MPTAQMGLGWPERPGSARSLLVASADSLCLHVGGRRRIWPDEHRRDKKDLVHASIDMGDGCCCRIA
eukprot:10845733-Karenia_brevis.AAC.1